MSLARVEQEMKLRRLTRDELVTIAYNEGCRESAFISEMKGPYPKGIIVNAILDNREARKKK